MKKRSKTKIRYIGNRWGRVYVRLIEDENIGHAAARIGAWLSLRPPGWNLRIGHMLATLGVGDAQWATARKELIAGAYITEITPTRGPDGRFSDAGLRFDALLVRDVEAESVQTAGQETEGPEGQAPGCGNPGPVKRGERPRGLGNPGANKDDVKEHEEHSTSNNNNESPEQPNAVDKDPANQLMDVLNRHKVEMSLKFCQGLSSACRGASTEQIDIAVVALSSAIQNKTVKSPHALATALARHAAKNNLTDNSSPPLDKSNRVKDVTRMAADFVQELEQLGGLFGAKIKGDDPVVTYTVSSEGRLYFKPYEGGTSLMIDEASAAQIWLRVKRGELVLMPKSTSRT